MLTSFISVAVLILWLTQTSAHTCDVVCVHVTSQVWTCCVYTPHHRYVDTCDMMCKHNRLYLQWGYLDIVIKSNKRWYLRCGVCTHHITGMLIPAMWCVNTTGYTCNEAILILWSKETNVDTCDVVYKWGSKRLQRHTEDITGMRACPLPSNT